MDEERELASVIESLKFLLKAMTTSKPQKRGFFEFAMAYNPAILRGALVGSIIGLAAPTVAKFVGADRKYFAGLISDSVVWPSRP